jgi:predicted PhzF superfamily epimerase YddE/YHI9
MRIFTPRAELDFAGHPTVGTAPPSATVVVKPKGAPVFACALGLID